ncbi:hypothetical protein SIAM614_11088 [Stappia aggregata IAM 12614]|uniref:Uncharacterized protein n=1 Tax=Roseibium aggregatum (strain ATCC 25650 / DSM 13394 / JCM 20685 / NBRC 16684 / NCIMB 2208 / IAM 12614 / B1) TaxID=384765 RepID=A0NMS5_ROSAI|nr:hypothetical protein SIAM614_11088 [Stappia aggregata IAM 12614] [Roseibium aggregatum IAM 12614]
MYVKFYKRYYRDFISCGCIPSPIKTEDVMIERTGEMRLSSLGLLLLLAAAAMTLFADLGSKPTASAKATSVYQQLAH